MDLKLEGRVALVTGASKGIGRATAAALAGEGCDLVLVSRTLADLEAVRDAIGTTHDIRVEVTAADLSLGSAVDALAEAFPAVDILVNNAGAIPGGNLASIDEATWRRAWDLKVFGYVNMCRRFYASMKRRGGGVIVNVIGNAAATHDPDYICGVTGNAALCAFTQSLGSVSARDGIRVVGINPGPVATDRLVGLLRRRLQESGAPGADGDDQALFQGLPFGRAASPEEIAAAVAFLSSDLSGYSTGSIATIDAGLSARSNFS